MADRSPPNSTVGFPAYGSPVGGLPPGGLTGHTMGCGKEEQPIVGKESTGPIEMDEPMASSGFPTTAAEDAAEPHSGPAIQMAEGRTMTVQEILKPADQAPIEVRDDRPKTLTSCALCLTATAGFELLETRGPRRPCTLSK